MKHLKLISILATVITTGFTAPAVISGDEDDNIFCTYIEWDHKSDRRVFWSAVFLGDYSWTIGYTNKFRHYLEAEYDLDGIQKYCFYESDAAAAADKLEDRIRKDKRNNLYDQVIMTNWAPDNFSNQPLQDFNVTIRGGSDELDICVRDHECEDGDAIRVTVDGSRIFSGEIDNDWVCDEVSVSAGERYAIELFAINGTGNKGNCSYADVNTGEIRISGATTETQSWQHRGGAGSRARIIVETE